MSPVGQNCLNARELRDRQRALLRIVAARVEEYDDGGMSAEELTERDRDAVVILEDSRFDRLAALPGLTRPETQMAETARQRAARPRGVLVARTRAADGGDG